MSYFLTRFGAVELPLRRTTIPIDTGRAASPVVPLIGGGGYRTLQGNRAARGVLELPYKAAHTSDDDWIWAATADALRAKVGMRDKLYRKRLDVDYSEWVWAELSLIDGDVKAVNRRYLDQGFTFTVYDALWRGSLYGSGIIVGTPAALPGTGLLVGGSTETTFLLDAAHLTPNLITLPCGGNMPVRAATITVTPAGTSITAITIEGMTAGVPKWKITYTDPVPVGTQLVINTGAKSVRTLASGIYTSAYAHFAPDYSVAQTTDWFLLDPRYTNTIRITKTGGNSSSVVSFLYYEASI